MSTEIQDLLDKNAIEEVLQRYCRTEDWLDEEGQASCFWPDADIDYGFFAGSGEDFVRTVMEHERSVARRWHLCTGVMIKLDGETAKAESYGIAVGANKPDSDFTMFGGRYLDELEKRNGEWRISKRVYILDWSHGFPNSMKAATADGFSLHILDIAEAGHKMYRQI